MRTPMEDRTINWLIQTLQDEFNQWVRLDAADENGYVKCCTCPITRQWNDRMDSGHCEKSTRSGTRFDPQNVAPQCTQCNRIFSGQQSAHRMFVDQKYGPGTSDILRAKAKSIKSWDRFELIEKIKEYRAKNKALKKLKNFME